MGPEQDISVGGGTAVSLAIAAAAPKKLLMLSRFWEGIHKLRKVRYKNEAFKVNWFKV